MEKQEREIIYETLIVIPSFHLKEYVEGLLKTIECKTPHAILLIDNGSKDELTEFCKEQAKKDNVFAYILEENLGASGAWNTGLSYAFEVLESSQIIILNNDTILYPWTINKMVEDLKRKDVGLVTGTDLSGSCVDEKQFKELKLQGKDDYKETPDFSCFGINKDCFMRVGYFDEAFYPAYFEDNDFHYRMKIENLKAIKNLGNYYFHFGSRTRQFLPKFTEYLKWRYLLNSDYYQKKWGGSPGEEKYTEPFNGKPPEELKIQKFEEYNDEVDRLNY